jgi:D-alanine-D-alanine ligase
MKEQLHIGVLRGGASTRYDISLKSGHALQVALEGKCIVHDIFVDKRGVWHRRGVAVTPEKALQGIDVAFNAMHGTYGEDGTLQKILSSLGVPYTGADAFAAATALDRAHAKEVLKKIPETRMPLHHVVSHYAGMHYAEKSHEIFSFFGPPYIVKALHGGTHEHVRIGKTLHDLPKAIHAVATATQDDVLVEQHEKGVHISCHVIAGFRGKTHYTTVPSQKVYDNGVNVSAQAPAQVTVAMKKRIEDAAVYVHTTLNLGHVSESHFIATERSLFFLSVDTSPLLTTASSLQVSLEAVGSSLGEYAQHLIATALTTKRYE